MDTEYVLFHNYEEQLRHATSAHEAITSLMDWLQTVGTSHIERDGVISESTFVASVDDNDANTSSIDWKSIGVEEAAVLLSNRKKLELCLVSSHVGIIITASACRLQDIVKRPMANETNIVRMLSHDDAINHYWQPTRLSAVNILSDVECRLFSIRLTDEISRSQMTPENIDFQLDFAEGTCAKMLNTVSPLKPTRKMIDELAKFFRVKPQQLWVNLTTYYLDESGQWGAFQQLPTHSD